MQMLKVEPQPFHVLLFSTKTKLLHLFFINALNKEDAKSQAYYWIRNHGFPLIVTKIYNYEEYNSKYPKPKIEPQTFFCKNLGWNVKKEECVSCNKNKLVPNCSVRVTH